MTNGVWVSFLVPCESVSMAEHRVLLSVTPPVPGLSSPAPNARLLHVQIVEGRPLRDLLGSDTPGPRRRS
jgi:hypothetical protein